MTTFDPDDRKQDPLVLKEIFSRFGGKLALDTSQFTPSRLGFFGTLGRNTLTSPGIATFDFSVLKTVPVKEKYSVQFRGEFFSLFNRANFGDPNTSPFTTSGLLDGDAGKITRTATSARQIQFALKFNF